MGVLIVFIGLCFLGYGLYKFTVLFWKLLKAAYFYLASEKQLDKELHRQWSKEKDYKDFENKIPKSL